MKSKVSFRVYYKNIASISYSSTIHYSIATSQSTSIHPESETGLPLGTGLPLDQEHNIGVRSTIVHP